MTVYVISVGLSVWDNLKDPYKKLTDPRLRAAVLCEKPHEMLAGILADAGMEDESRDESREAVSKWLAGELAVGGEPGQDPAHTGKLHEVAKVVQPDLWPPDMSAEAETFDRAGGFPLGRGDIAVLVCSDTPRGLLAGAWNALALTGADFTRIRYLPGPGEPLGMLRGNAGPGDPLGKRCVNAVLVRVPGMDASSAEGFRSAMRGLGLLACHLFKSGQLKKGEEFRFYLSGGFKAAIPYLIGLAEAVRSIDANRLGELGVPDLMPDDGSPYPVRAFVLHETAGPGAPAIELPLRWLDAEWIRGELAEFNASLQRPGIPGYGLLRGYAYDVKGPAGKETCTLTPFGEGLRALFGASSEHFG